MMKNSAITCLSPVDLLTNTIRPTELAKHYGIESNKSLFLFGDAEGDVKQTLSTVDDIIRSIREKESTGVNFIDMEKIDLHELTKSLVNEKLLKIDPNGKATLLTEKSPPIELNLKYLTEHRARKAEPINDQTRQSRNKSR